MFIRTKYWTKKANYWCSYLGKIKDWAKLSNELKTNKDLHRYLKSVKERNKRNAMDRI